MELAYALSLICAGFFATLVSQYIYRVWSGKQAFAQLSGPKSSSFIWGEEWNLFHKRPGTLYAEWHAKYGNTLAFSGALGQQIVSITDSRAVHFVLVEASYSFPKPAGVRAWFQATLGEGILWVGGGPIDRLQILNPDKATEKKEHELQRRMLASNLSQGFVKALIPAFVETSLLLCDRWNQFLSHKEGEVEIDVADWAARFALDTIGRAAFSYDFDCLAGEPNDLVKALDGLTNNEHNISSFYMRALFWIFPSVLSIGQKGQMIRKVKQELGQIALRMLKEKRMATDCDHQSILSGLLQAEKKTGLAIAEEGMVSQLRTLVSAAYEPVSALIAWLLYELAINCSIQEELRDEIRHVTISEQSNPLNNLPLLDAVFKEALRLHPPIIENHHETAETISIPLSNALPGSESKHIVVPKGTLLVIPVNVLHTLPSIWGEDALDFRPNRWLQRGDQKLMKEYPDIMSFSAGPRSCIGRTFATAEIKTLVVHLLQRFTFRCGTKIEPFQSFVVRPRVQGETKASLPLLVDRVQA